MKNREQKDGFTLVELLVALGISVMVFGAMGVLLVRGFSFWIDGTTQWQLAQQSRVARARILAGAQGPGSGVMSISQVNEASAGDVSSVVKYVVSTSVDEYWLSGMASSTAVDGESLVIKNNSDGNEFWAVTVSQKSEGGTAPSISTSSFRSSFDDDSNMLDLDYVMSFRRGGKLYEQPQHISTYLVNNEDAGYYVTTEEDVIEEDETDSVADDGDNGHGNDEDGWDESNPGKKKDYLYNYRRHKK